MQANYIISLIAFIYSLDSFSQSANCISNGSFEELNTYSLVSQFYCVDYWQSIDTSSASYYLATTRAPLSNAPYAIGFQYARSGSNYIISQFYGYRGYPRNRLKQTLKANTVYCVKFYVVNTNNNPYGIDSFGAYFGNSDLDTINYCNVPLVYLSPQIQSPQGNIMTDTLIWTSITGTFVANGTEKYMVLGNFRNDASTSTLLINPTYSANLSSADICIDDVSCIELNLPAFAGRDTSVVPGSSIFLGRQPDVGIDEACVWYKLPSTVPIDTVAGFWVNPSTTSTYVVVQSICGLVKSDTVVLHMNLTGIQDFKAESSMLKVYPNPANDLLSIESEFDTANNWNAVIQNNLGQIVHEQSITFKNQKADIDTKAFENGVYFMLLSSKDTFFKCQRFMVAR